MCKMFNNNSVFFYASFVLHLFLYSCSRLGLVSLSYLWQRDQEELLEEMIRSGMNAILIKVAALGLDPEKHLGRSLQQCQHELIKLVLHPLHFLSHQKWFSMKSKLFFVK